MLAWLLDLAATLVHAALIFALAPLLAGLVARARARLWGRRGPPLLQPYRNLRRLLRKATLMPETATDFYGIWPYLAFVPLGVAVFLIPGFCTGMVTASMGDFLILIGLFALSRAGMVLAGLETGFGFGGAAAARELMFGVFAEAAFLVAVLSLALIARTTTVDGIASVFGTAHLGVSVSLGFALAALLAVALTETGRIPVDNPAGHLELAMVHEAMVLEYSGRFLLLFEYAGMLRLMLWCSLIASIFAPFGMAQAGAPLTWPEGLATWLLKLLAMALGLALFEVSRAKMRVFRVPEFLGMAMLLGILSGVFLFVAARLAG